MFQNGNARKRNNNNSWLSSIDLFSEIISKDEVQYHQNDYYERSENYYLLSKIWSTKNIPDNEILLDSTHSEQFTAQLFLAPKNLRREFEYKIYLYENVFNDNTKNISLKLFKIIPKIPIEPNFMEISYRTNSNEKITKDYQSKIFICAESFLLINDIHSRLLLIDFRPLVVEFLELFKLQSGEKQMERKEFTDYVQYHSMNVIGNYDEEVMEGDIKKIYTYVFLGIGLPTIINSKNPTKEEQKYKIGFFVLNSNTFDNQGFVLHNLRIRDFNKLFEFKPYVQVQEQKIKNYSVDMKVMKMKHKKLEKWIYFLIILVHNNILQVMTNWTNYKLNQILLNLNDGNEISKIEQRIQYKVETCEISRVGSSNYTDAGARIFIIEQFPGEFVIMLYIEILGFQFTLFRVNYCNDLLKIEKSFFCKSNTKHHFFSTSVYGYNQRTICSITEGYFFALCGEVFEFFEEYNKEEKPKYNIKNKLSKEKLCDIFYWKKYRINFIYSKGKIFKVIFKPNLYEIFDKPIDWNIEQIKYEQKLINKRLNEVEGSLREEEQKKMQNKFETKRIEFEEEQGKFPTFDIQLDLILDVYKSRIQRSYYKYVREINEGQKEAGGKVGGEIMDTLSSVSPIDSTPPKGTRTSIFNIPKKNKLLCSICNETAKFVCVECKKRFYCSIEHYNYNFENSHFFECQLFQFFDTIKEELKQFAEERKKIDKVNNNDNTKYSNLFNNVEQKKKLLYAKVGRYSIITNELILRYNKILNFIFSKIINKNDYQTYLQCISIMINLMNVFSFPQNMSLFRFAILNDSQSEQKFFSIVKDFPSVKEFVFYNEVFFYYFQLNLLYCTFTYKSGLKYLTDSYLKTIINNLTPKIVSNKKDFKINVKFNENFLNDDEKDKDSFEGTNVWSKIFFDFDKSYDSYASKEDYSRKLLDTIVNKDNKENKGSKENKENKNESPKKVNELFQSSETPSSKRYRFLEMFQRRQLLCLSMLPKLKILLNSSASIWNVFLFMIKIFFSVQQEKIGTGSSNSIYNVGFRDNRITSRSLSKFCLIYLLVECGYIHQAINILNELYKDTQNDFFQDKIKMWVCFNLGVLEFSIGRFGQGIHHIEESNRIYMENEIKVHELNAKSTKRLSSGNVVAFSSNNLNKKYYYRITESLGFAYLNQKSLIKAYILFSSSLYERVKSLTLKNELAVLKLRAYLSFITDMYEYSYILKTLNNIFDPQRIDSHELLMDFIIGDNTLKDLEKALNLDEFIKIVKFFRGLSEDCLMKLDEKNSLGKNEIKLEDYGKKSSNSALVSSGMSTSTITKTTSTLNLKEQIEEKERRNDNYVDEIFFDNESYEKLNRKQQTELPLLRANYLKRSIILRDTLGKIEQFNLNFHPIFTEEFSKLIGKIRSNYMIKQVYISTENYKWKKEIFSKPATEILSSLAMYLNSDKIKTMNSLERVKIYMKYNSNQDRMLFESNKEAQAVDNNNYLVFNSMSLDNNIPRKKSLFPGKDEEESYEFYKILKNLIVEQMGIESSQFIIHKESIQEIYTVLKDDPDVKKILIRNPLSILHFLFSDISINDKINPKEISKALHKGKEKKVSFKYLRLRKTKSRRAGKILKEEEYKGIKSTLSGYFEKKKLYELFDDETSHKFPPLSITYGVINEHIRPKDFSKPVNNLQGEVKETDSFIRLSPFKSKSINKTNDFYINSYIDKSPHSNFNKSSRNVSKISNSQSKNSNSQMKITSPYIGRNTSSQINKNSSNVQKTSSVINKKSLTNNSKIPSDSISGIFKSKSDISINDNDMEIINSPYKRQPLRNPSKRKKSTDSNENFYEVLTGSFGNRITNNKISGETFESHRSKTPIYDNMNSNNNNHNKKIVKKKVRKPTDLDKLINHTKKRYGNISQPKRETNIFKEQKPNQEYTYNNKEDKANYQKEFKERQINRRKNMQKMANLSKVLRKNRIIEIEENAQQQQKQPQELTSNQKIYKNDSVDRSASNSVLMNDRTKASLKLDKTKSTLFENSYSLRNIIYEGSQSSFKHPPIKAESVKRLNRCESAPKFKYKTRNNVNISPDKSLDLSDVSREYYQK